MALSHAILVSLLDRPQSGYDLAKRFDRTVGFFWKVSHQQIYLELHKLARSGWVASAPVEPSERPNRIAYQLTEDGRNALDQWMLEPTEPPNFKEEMIVKLFALEASNRDTIRKEIERRRDLHTQRLAHYQALMAEHYPEPARLSARRRGRYLGLRMGIVTEQTTIAWCEEAIACIDLDAPKRTKSDPARPR
jgi:PadR family transcriptional regulator AphA